MIGTNQIIQGDARNVLADLPENSVHAVMTSPPYWNLRDYDHADQLGREETADAYVENLAAVFDEVARVLRPDGSLWLNLGDTYDSKDLQQIPARVALELQSRGWILRNRVTWAKPNPMPQSVKDRLNDTTEAIFHFVRERSYWYDLDAIREDFSDETIYRINSDIQPYDTDGLTEQAERDEVNSHRQKEYADTINTNGKNPGDVFEVTVKPFADAHFAVYPPELCEKPIKATCPEDGVVLDPFAGAGTTCLKAKELGRRFVGIELNPEYADMARARIGLSPNDPSNVRDNDAQTGLEAYGDD